MQNEIKYTSINRVLDSLLDHPMLRDLTLEQAVRHTLRFIALHGYSKLYEEKVDIVTIKEHRGVLPCDLVSIIQVKDCASKICMRSMTDTFTPGLMKHESPKRKANHEGEILPTEPMHRHSHGELTFKTQGRIIFTSFPEGTVEIAYKAIPVDDDGYPLLIDNEVYLATLEAYIKKQAFTVKYDQQKLPAAILQNTQLEYTVLVGQLREEFETPSLSEMESISRALNTMIPNARQFDHGFKHLGDREYLINH